MVLYDRLDGGVSDPPQDRGSGLIVRQFYLSSYSLDLWSSMTVLMEVQSRSMELYDRLDGGVSDPPQSLERVGVDSQTVLSVQVQSRSMELYDRLDGVSLILPRREGRG
ncbi:hypothetical protein RRG08_044314 [Elysia crispata]|uniref:Uncharacterized protein n=1 Tax=Elysia crispata TaxID=231223 RepID=A0AAE0XYC5_9GAST|nr:hypothetical protein RRG08_044314 [Elysia crispata]